MNVFFLLVSTAVFAIVAAEDTPRFGADDFDKWVLHFGKEYKDAGALFHARSNWVANHARVEAINSAKGSWMAAMTRFADLSSDEFRDGVLAKRSPSMATSQVHANVHSSSVMGRAASHPRQSAAVRGDAPVSFDWRDVGGVSPVQDQGTVGTCWAFSTVGNVEGQWFLHSNKTLDLSDEYLVDCDGSHDDIHADCSIFGGWPYLAYGFIMKAGGLPSEKDYPYCAGTGDCYPCMLGPKSLCGPPPYYCDEDIVATQCPPNKQNVAAKIRGWTAISDDEEEMRDLLPTVGPMSVLLDATQLQFYQSGVWDGKVPGSPDFAGCRDYLNHAVLAVGYGTDADAGDYWIVKNSWADSWGEDGYFRITRGEGTCGINTAVTSSFT